MTKNKHQNKRAADNGLKICFVEKKAYPREEMLRFVISPERVVVFDVNEKLPGTGIWLYPTASNLKNAIQKKLFYKAAGGTVTIPEELFESIQKTLKERCLNLLGLARKAGYLVFGFEGVKKAIETQEIIIAFEATDSSEKGKTKIYRPTDEFLICSCFTREELGQVTGQEAQVHIVVLKSKIATELKQTALKLDLLSDLEKKG